MKSRDTQKAIPEAPASLVQADSGVTGKSCPGQAERHSLTTPSSSVGFTCDTYGNQANLVYDVAGYKYLTAVVGVPSDAANAAGNAMTITFFKDGSTQLGQSITVSLDHPQSVRLPLQDASQLQMSCNATNVTSHQPVYMDAALGNATIGPS